MIIFRKETVKFAKGEEVLAMWSPYQKYPATIQAVLANGMGLLCLKPVFCLLLWRDKKSVNFNF